jgi:hypothetical protein
MKRTIFWDITPCSPLKNIASIFIVEELAEQDTNLKTGGEQIVQNVTYRLRL